jgi:general stress protein 26
MNSIDRNQPEKNHQDLSGSEAREKIKELVEEAQTCFFCTKPSSEGSHSRPRSVQQIDDAGNIWFLSANDSYKNEELEANPLVDLYFQGSTHSDFLHLKGSATISTDRDKIKELWEPVLATWFTEGVEDPRITVIKVEPSEGHYWDNKHGNAVAGVKMIIGAIIGKTLDDSIQGKITV